MPQTYLSETHSSECESLLKNNSDTEYFSGFGGRNGHDRLGLE